MSGSAPKKEKNDLRRRVTSFFASHKRLSFIAMTLFNVAGGAAVTAILLVAKFFLDSHPLIQYYEYSLYGTVQSRCFREPDPQENLDVVIVDISPLKQVWRKAEFANNTTHREDQWEPITPRDRLLRIIEAIAKNGATGIGIDLDLSPTNDNYCLQKDDRMLLDQCINISNDKAVDPEGVRIPACNVKIALSDRSEYKDDSPPLGDSRYNTLCTSSNGPDYIKGGEKETDPWWMPLNLYRNEISVMPGLAASFVPSATNMLESIQPAWLEQLNEFTPKNFHPAINRSSTLHTTWTQSAYWVDYTQLFRFADTSILASDAAAINDARDRIKNKFVLVGDIEDAPKNDRMELPGITGDAAGILAHACGIETLLQGPIYQPSKDARWWADIIASATIILGVQILRGFHLCWTGKDVVDSHEAHKTLTRFFMTLILITTYLLSYEWRIVWADAAVVFASLVLHRHVERWIVDGFLHLNRQIIFQNQTSGH